MSDGVTRALRGPAREIEAASRSAAERLTQRLAEDADVAYGLTDSPIGTLLIANSPRGLVRLHWIEGDQDEILDEVARDVSPRILHAPARVDAVRRELDEYFAGTRMDFEVPVDWGILRGFTRKVLEATARIPYGAVATYSEMALRAGSPRGMRAAGNALGANPIPVVVPCHRVLRTGGALGGYGGGLERKRILLRLEGMLDP